MERWNRRDWRAMAFLGLMLASPMASASDFTGALTLFLGFPTIVFCNVLLGVLVAELCVAPRSMRALLLLPFYLLILLLFAYIAFVSGFLMLRGGFKLGSGFGLILATSLVAAFVLVWIAVVYLLRFLRNKSGKAGFAKIAAWSVLVLAMVMSVPIGFDLKGMLEHSAYNSHANEGPFVLAYVLLLGLVPLLHYGFRRILSGPRKTADGEVDVSRPRSTWE
jgi:hypothetical protein